jgi:hypothetical protein
MRSIYGWALIALATTVSACTVKTDVAPVPSAAAEVMSSRSFNSPVIVEYGFTPQDLDVKVATSGYRGSACTFPLSLSGALYATFDAVNNQAFHHIVAAPAPEAYRIRIAFASFEPTIRFDRQAFGSEAVAQADIALRVSIHNPKGDEISRQIVRGTGQDQEEVGACSDGNKPLSTAVQKALRNLAEEYADRVINELHIE